MSIGFMLFVVSYNRTIIYLNVFVNNSYLDNMISQNETQKLQFSN